MAKEGHKGIEKYINEENSAISISLIKKGDSMFLSKQQVVLPLYQRFGICKFCGYKLNFWERKRKTNDGKVICRRCGTVYADKNIMY